MLTFYKLHARVVADPETCLPLWDGEWTSKNQWDSQTHSFNCFDQPMVLVLVVSISALPSFKSDCSCSSWTSWSSWPTQCHKWPWTEKITVFRVMMLLLRFTGFMHWIQNIQKSKHVHVCALFINQIYSNLLQSTLWQKCNKLRAYLSYIVQASSSLLKSLSGMAMSISAASCGELRHRPTMNSWHLRYEGSSLPLPAAAAATDSWIAGDGVLCSTCSSVTLVS